MMPLFQTRASYEQTQQPVQMTPEQLLQARRDVQARANSAQAAVQTAMARLDAAELDPAIDDAELETLRRDVRQQRIAEVAALRAVADHEAEFGDDAALWNAVQDVRGLVELEEQATARESVRPYADNVIAALDALAEAQKQLDGAVMKIRQRWPADTMTGRYYIPAHAGWKTTWLGLQPGWVVSVEGDSPNATVAHQVRSHLRAMFPEKG